MFTSLFMKTFLYLSLTCLIVEPKFGHEFGLFSKQKKHKEIFSSSQNEPLIKLFCLFTVLKKKKNYEFFVYLDRGLGNCLRGFNKYKS